MKIANLKLKDFRSYETAEIQFNEPLSIIKGANHSGKTSIAQAIKLSFTKSCDGTDPRGAGANDKIRYGQNKASIETVVDGALCAITLHTTYGPGKTGRQQRISASKGEDGKDYAGSFDRMMEARSESLSCVLDAEYFTNPKTDQKAILAALVLPTSYDFDAELRTMVEKRLGARYKWDGNPVKLIDAIYQEAYDARKTAKAVLNSIRMPDLPAKPAYDSEKIQKAITAARANVNKEAKKIKGESGRKRGQLEQQLEVLEKSLATYEKDLAACLNDRKETLSTRRSESEIKGLKKTALRRALYDKLTIQMAQVDADAEQQKAAQSVYADLLECPVCPTCTQAITKEFVDGKIAAHQKLEEEYSAQYQSFREERETLGNIDEVEAKLAEHERNIKLAAEAIQSEKLLTEVIEKFLPQIESFEKALAEPDEVEPDASELVAANQELAEWEAKLGPAVAYETTVKNIEKVREQIEEKEAEVADLEILCRKFGKDGIKAQLIEEHIGLFTETVNEVLRAWGYEASLSIEPYEFTVSGHNGVLPLKELSGSERLMFSVALQCAIAKFSKLKFVVVDRADTLLDSERNRLFKCLKVQLDTGELDQAIVLVSDLTEIPAKKAGVQYYFVSQGKVQAL